MANVSLSGAKNSKKDEFYTQLADIEQEMTHYRGHFENKVIFLNCDDPSYSSFWQYFSLNFDFLGLKKLISTHYDPAGEPSYKLEIERQMITKQTKVKKTNLKEDGDFRSAESIECLKEADIIITNPPFSIFREYVKQLMDHKKDFIIIGNQNAFTYREIFKLLKNDIIWVGYNYGSMEFKVPNNYEAKSVYIKDDGKKYQKLGNITWFTNLDIKKRHEDMVLTEFYESNEDRYPKYGNYNAIEISRVKNIPMDYKGIMGVPITFLSNYSPEQFDIVGINTSYSAELNDKEAQRIKIYENVKQHSKDGKISSGNKINDSSVIELDEKPIDTYYIANNCDKYLVINYARLFIKNKKPISKSEILDI